MSSGAPSTQTTGQSASTGQLTVQCSCGKKLKAPASAVGKRAKCPGCGNVLTIPAVAPVAAKQAVPVGAAQPAAVGAAAKPAAAPKRKPAAIGPVGAAPPPPPVHDDGV